jgi:hypothetical protein
MFVRSKDKIISCDSRSIINDYLILKANTSPNLSIGIVCYMGNISPLIQQMYDRIMEIPDAENNFEHRVKAHQVWGQHILKFLNGTRIEYIRDERCDPDMRGKAFDICYLTKCAAINSNHMISILTSLHQPHSRLIKHTI